MIDDLVRQMSTPEFYALPGATPVRHVQTHISHVFLTGEYAYKIKKPVNLGFLDFSTLDKREFFCHEELRLNRRFAPELYLDVVPIFRVGAEFALGQAQGDGKPVEYAVKMRQFDESDLLTNWLRDGKLSEAHVRDIARKMVQFHSQADASARIASFGTPAAVEEMIEDNFNVLERFVGHIIERERFDRIRSAVMGAIRDRRGLIEARARSGRVRECHGDLHLRNLCCFKGEIRFFDCIEFNEEYRCIDVMCELAFLAMDLDYRQRPDLANVLVNTYLEESGDYSGAALLPTYLAVRAWIRAKVACLLIEDPNLSPKEIEEARESANAHFAYADRRVGARKPTLILVCGVSGTGKSTVARELAKRLDAIHIRSDAVRKHLVGVPLTTRSATAYTAKWTEDTYATMLRHARELLHARWPVLLDATFLRAGHRDAARDLARELHTRFHIIHLDAPESLLRGRIEARVADASDATPDLVSWQLASFEPFLDAERPFVTFVDATGAIDVESLTQRVRMR